MIKSILIINCPTYRRKSKYNEARATSVLNQFASILENTLIYNFKSTATGFSPSDVPVTEQPQALPGITNEG